MLFFKFLLAAVPLLMPIPELPEIHPILGGNWVGYQCLTDTECEEWEARETLQKKLK